MTLWSVVVTHLTKVCPGSSRGRTTWVDRPARVAVRSEVGIVAVIRCSPGGRDHLLVGGLERLLAERVGQLPRLAQVTQLGHLCIEVSLRHDLDLEQHLGVVGAAELGALTLVLADLGGDDLELVRLARDDVELLQEGRHPERVDDVAGVEDELGPLVDRQVQHGRGRAGDASPGVELGVHARLVDVGVDVVEVPAPLLGDDVDGDVWLGIGVEQHRLVAGGVVEQDGDHEHRHDRVEQLDRHVVAQLRWQRVVVPLAPVDDQAPDGQPPDQEADEQGGDPGPDPQVDDPTGLGRHLLAVATRGQKATGDAAGDVRAAAEQQGGEDRESDQGPTPPRNASRGVDVLTQRAPSESKLT